MKDLSIENLTSGYQNQEILHQLSLHARYKETLVLMGPSGSGKTTLLLTILGILRPNGGKIVLNDIDLTKQSIEERNIGYLPQDYGLFPHMNVFENVIFGLYVRKVPKEKRKEKAQEILNLVNLRGFEERKIHELSGGERQRVGLARALAIDPSLLLLDEPLSNVDQVTKRDVAEQLKALFQKLDVPIILVTHNHEDALFLADRIAILIQGRIEQIGPLQEVMDHPKTEFIQRLLRPFA